MCKMYISELRKLIKEKQDLLERVIYERKNNEDYSYTQTEKDSYTIVYPAKDLKQYTAEIDAITAELHSLKKQLRLANETICENLETIADNIFTLKQKTAIYQSMIHLLNKNEISRSTNYNKEVEYTQLNFDKNWLEEYLNQVKQEINSLQDNIDRANLTTKL